jgi:biotin carboxyl carrier protein
MKFAIRLSGAFEEESRIVELNGNADCWSMRLDGISIQADAVEISPNIFSILHGGESHEVRVTPSPNGKLTIEIGSHAFTAEIVDPRAWRGRRHGAIEAAGRQQVVAPMPGKVVRVLVQAGDAVGAGQGLVVIEAMKMQNEICSPKGGSVKRVLAKEGQLINAGETVAWVE